MKIERFQYFVKVAHLGSITAAAKKCYISQTAMSQQMDALEHDLGVRVLKRTKTGTSLTPEGEKLLPKAEALLAEYQNILALFAEEDQAPGELTVAYTGPAEQQLLLKAIPEFQRLHPDGKVWLRHYAMADIGYGLESGECDVALAIAGEIEGREYRHISVRQEPVYVALPKSSPLAGEESLTLDRLRRDKIILLETNMSVHASEAVRQWLRARDWPEEQILYADTIENQLLMISLGMGFTMVPWSSYADGISLVPMSDAPIHRVEAVTKRMTPLCRDMIRLLKQATKAL